MYRAHATKQKDGEICKAAPVGVGGETEKLEWACSSRRRSKMLADVGMVKTYSKSAHVNDLGFAWTSPPPCSYGFSARWFCHTLQVHTAPSLHLPLFLEETFYIPLFLHFLWNTNYTWASQLLRLPNNSGNKGAFSESWQGLHANVSIADTRRGRRVLDQGSPPPHHMGLSGDPKA